MTRARKPTINPEEHLGILHHVVNSATMNIPAHLKDEALSEGMVLLVHASQSYDARHGVPPHFWIAKKLRWGLLNWKLAEARKHGAEQPILVPLRDQKVMDETAEYQEEPAIDHEAYDPIRAHEKRLELEMLVLQAGEILEDQEYLAVFGEAIGMHWKELSHALKANPNQIRKLQERGRNRINEMRML